MHENAQGAISELTEQRNQAWRDRDAAMVQRDDAMVQRDEIMLHRNGVMKRAEGLAALAVPAIAHIAASGLPRALSGERPLASTIICGGAPGSGNGIAGAMLERLIPGPPALSALADALRFAAGQRTTELMNVGNALAATHGFDECALATHRDGSASLRFSTGGAGDTTSVVFFGVPIANAFHEHIHKTHEVFSGHFGRLLSMGAGLVLVVRHPLDILVSVARKVSIGGVDLVGREEILVPFLNDLVRYYRSFESISPDQMLMLRYEDILTDLPGAASLMAAFVRRWRPDVLEAAAIDDQLLGADVGAVGHRWQPGAGKWKRFLSSSMSRVIVDARVPDLARDLGFGDVDLSSLPDCAEKLPVADVDTNGLAVLVASASSADAVPEMASRLGLVCEVAGRGIVAVTNKASVDRYLRPLVSDERLRQILTW